MFSGLFGTSRFSNVSPDDKEKQAKIQAAAEKNKKVYVKNPQSTRYSIDPDTSGATGIWTSNELASTWEDPSSTNFNVASTAVQDIKYDPKTEDLQVRFQGGKTWYTYPGVPAEVFTEFMDSPSKGKYLMYEISPKYSK